MKHPRKRGITQIQTIAIVAVVIIAIAAAWYFTRPTKPEIEEVKIGLLIPLTGPYAYLGEVVTNGVTLAVEEINAAGGVKSLGGVPLKLVTYDTGGTTNEATSALQRMIATEGGTIPGIILPWPSGYALAVSEITEREEIPMMCTAWADTITTRGFDYVFRFSPTSSGINEGVVPALLGMAEAAGYPASTIGFIYDDNPATIGLIESLRAIAQETPGLELVVDEMWSTPLRDATPLVAKVQAADPDITFIYAISLPDMILVKTKWDEVGVRSPLVGYGGSLMNEQFMDTMGEMKEGMLVISDWNVMKGMEELEQTYLDRFEVRLVPKDAGMCYSIAYALYEAIEEAESIDPVEVRNALASIDIDSGPAAYLYGRIKFNPNGDLASAVPVITQWQGDELLTIFPTDLATGTVQWPEN